MELDLNLLRVFDALFQSRSVTRTAQRMNVTQSAVSHALARLRDALGDELFVRGPGGLEPTSRAIAIAPGIRDGLTRLRGALASPTFDPAAANRSFTIAAGSYPCAMLIPSVAAAVRAEAAGVSLRIMPNGGDAVGALDKSQIDVALGVFPDVPSRLVCEPLFEEELVWIAAAANPLTGGLVDQATLASQPRVGIAPAYPPETGAVEVNERTMLQRVLPKPIAWLKHAAADPFVTVYNSETAIAIVARSDAIALVPRRAVPDRHGPGDVAILRTTDALPPITLTMLWHRKQREDQGLAWLRTMLLRAANP